jgi:hypothetical protein
MNKKYLIYGSIGVVVLIAIYYATKSPDTPIIDGVEDDSSEGEPSSDKTKSKEQITIDPKLASLTLEKNWAKTIKGKNIYSKLDNVKLRKTEYVNDGVINNLYGTVDKKGTLLGVAEGVYLDYGKATNPATKTRYNWIRVQLNNTVYNEIQKNQRNFATRDLLKVPKVYVFVREDAIKL